MSSCEVITNVERFLDIRQEKRHPNSKVHFKYSLLVKWEGYEAEADQTWECLTTLIEDVPLMVQTFLHEKFGIQVE